MDEENGKSDGDSKGGKATSSSSSSSSSGSELEEENNRPSSSGCTSNFARFKVNKIRKRSKKQNCNRKKESKGQDDSAHDSNEERDSAEPSSSAATFHKLQKRIKRRSYRRATSDTEEEATEVAPREESTASAMPEEDTTAKSSSEDDSSTESEAHEKEDSEDSSDAWKTTDEESQVTPLVLRKIKPKSTLSIVNEVMNRQIGRSRRFDKKMYGSLHMVERLKYLHSLDEHRGCVNTVEFNRKGDLLVSGSDDLAIIVWNWAMGKKVRSYRSGHRNNIFQASWIPRDDLALIMTCSSDGQVRLLDEISGSTRKLASHQGACNKFAIHPEVPHLAISVGDDGKILSIDVRDGETTKLVTLKERGFPVQLYSVHCNPRNENEFCVGGHSESVKIYDLRKPSTPVFKLCPKNLVDNNVHITAVTYNYNGTEILASYSDDDIYLFDTLMPNPDGDYVHRYQGHRNSRTIKGVDYFGPKSEFIVSGSDCGNVYFWEKNTEAIVQYMLGDAQGVVNRVKGHPYVPVLATSGLDDDVKIWVPGGMQASSLSDLKLWVTKNMKDRAEGRSHRRHGWDSTLFCVILARFCQNRAFGLLETRLDEDEDDDSDDD